MILTNKKIVDELNKIVEDILSKSPEKHLQNAEVWATKKTKESIPEYMKI